MNSQIKLQIRPNNQITLTIGSWRKKMFQPSQSPIFEHDRISYSDIEDKKEQMYNHRVMQEYLRTKSKSRPRPKLDIIQKSQRPQKIHKSRLNKPKNFTRVSGQKLRECGAALDIASENNPEYCNCVTLTLPANTKEAFTALAAYSGYAINRLFQPIRRDYGNAANWFFVWEYQKRGALHLHIAVHHAKLGESTLIGDRLIKQWHKVLCDIGTRANCCMFTAKQGDRCTIKSLHQNDNQVTQKSVGGYFSKYAGKEESKQNWYCQKYPVSRFWGCSYSVKEIIKKHSCEYSFDYQGNESECSKKYEQIIQNLIEQLNIVSTSQYSFAIALQGQRRLNHYKNGKKILVVDQDKIIASGDRFTFYFSPENLATALNLAANECEYF